jgi:hypothetical protein
MIDQRGRELRAGLAGSVSTLNNEETMHILRTAVLAAAVAAAFAGCGKSGGGYMGLALRPATTSTSVQVIQSVVDSRNAR